MRVTDNISRRQFLTNNNLALTQMLQSENRIATQRRYNRVSEDIINASKDLVVRRQLRDLGIYNDNLSSIGALFFAAEKNLTFIAHDKYIAVEERLVQASNGTYDQSQMISIATELDQIAESMVTTLNNDFSERELFGGASNGQTPFRLERAVVKKGDEIVFPPDYNKYYDKDGNVLEGLDIEDIPRTVTYNGIPLDFDVTSSMVKPDGTIYKPAENDEFTVTLLDTKTKKFPTGDNLKEYENTQTITKDYVNAAIKEKNNSLLYPGSKPVYVDIGLGIKYNDKYEVDPQTALDVSMNGAKITGCGIDMSGVETSQQCSAAVDTALSGKLKSGLDPAVGDDTSYGITLTVDGAEITVIADLSALAKKPAGEEYTDEEISKVLNDAVKTAAEGMGAELPDGFTVGYADGKLTASADKKAFELKSIGMGINDAVKSTEAVAMNENGTPDVSERFSKNLIQLVLDAATALKHGDQDTVNAIIDRANEANNHILTEITTLGAKENTIDFYVEKNKDYDYNLKERQNVVEGTDMENEIMRYEAIRAAYDATLKMGSQLLPHSIFDFV